MSWFRWFFKKKVEKVKDELFSTNPYGLSGTSGTSGTIGVFMNSGIDNQTLLNDFIWINHYKVKHVWKKRPKDYNIYRTTKGLILERITEIDKNDDNHIGYEGNLSDLFRKTFTKK